MDQPVEQHLAAGARASSLGPMLEGSLCATCESLGVRLSNIEWFRSDWQRGGGSTGFATLTTADGAERPVVIKLPVGPAEHRWTCALGRDPLAPTPRVYAQGDSIGPHDLAWLVMERIPGSPIGRNLEPAAITDMLRACAQVQARCEAIEPVASDAPVFPFEKLIEQGRAVAHNDGIPDSQRWAHELRSVQRALPMLLRRWSTRRLNAWCHGDLHGGNAMRRADGSCVLIDLALIHPGHWLEDALYLERVCWSRMQAKSRADTAARAAGNGWHGQHFGDRHAFSHHGAASHAGDHKGEKHRSGGADQSPSLLSQMAGFRRELGLACDDDYGMLANVRRVLMAACAPAWIQREGNPLHLAHALELIQKLLPMVGR